MRAGIIFSENVKRLNERDAIQQKMKIENDPRAHETECDFVE